MKLELDLILCSERLPEIDKDVLLINKEGLITVGGWSCFSNRPQHRYWYISSDIVTGQEYDFEFDQTFENVMYWAEIPNLRWIE
jgi:hypothetical protein